MTGLAVALVMRDIRLAWAGGGAALQGVIFLLMAAAVIAFAAGPDPALLAKIGPGMLWVLALLSSLLSLDRLFQADYDDGSLEELALSPLGLTALCALKALAHWLGVILPLIAAAPLLALMFGLDGERTAALVVSLLVASPALSLIGSIGAALTVMVRRGGVLISLLVMPLYIPSLLFGLGAAGAAGPLGDGVAATALAGATSLTAAVIGPVASAAAIRLALE